MATLEQILAGMIEFRNTVYQDFADLNTKIDGINIAISDTLTTLVGKDSLKTSCNNCNGTGQTIKTVIVDHVLQTSTVDCDKCSGTGIMSVGKMRTNSI